MKFSCYIQHLPAFNAAVDFVVWFCHVSQRDPEAKASQNREFNIQTNSGSLLFASQTRHTQNRINWNTVADLT